MYQNIVILNSVTHRTVRLSPVTDFSFGGKMNSCIVLGQEFLEAAKYYPIVFASSADSITPVVILGVQDNLFIGDQNIWEKETYIPAFMRRYPYILAEGLSQDGSLTVCLDTDYVGFNHEQGERLFTDEGENTPLLNNAIEFLRTYQNQFEATKAFTNRIKELNIFKSVDANISLQSGENFAFRNFLMVDEEAMYRLADEEIVKLVRQGYMPWIYAHLYATTNFSRILNRMKNVVKKQDRG
jgi:hypothetical protein